MDVRPIPGLEHLPFAEVWFHAIDEESWREASAAARAIGKPGIEAWTTGATPEVAAFLERRGFEQVRHYAISELDVAAAPDPDPPSIPLTTFALRPDLAGQLYEIAREAYPDQPGREETPAAGARGMALVGARSAPAGRLLRRRRGGSRPRLRLSRARRRSRPPRLHRRPPRSARPRHRRRDQARADRVGEARGPAHAAHGE